MKKSGWFFALFLCPLLLSGCALRMGPKTVARDRFDYSAALANSWKEQMVTNLVKLRYMDPPTFLEVAQFVASYTFEGSAGITLPDWTGAAAGSAAGLEGRWTESPTITYNPIGGEKFARSLLRPLSPVAIFSLIQAGWPVDNVLAVSVRNINGLHATTSVEMFKKTGDARFYHLLGLLRELQLSEAFALRVVASPKEETGLLVLRPNPKNEALHAKAMEVCTLLGLNTQLSEFSLTFSAAPKSDTEIAMVTRSMLEILAEASTGVDVPAADLAEGRVARLPERADQGDAERRFHIHIRSSPNRPATGDAYALIRYRRLWFWIDDRDLSSKRGMGFLMTLFNLAESGTTASPPMLTISKP